jgi:hypothetical protein
MVRDFCHLNVKIFHRTVNPSSAYKQCFLKIWIGNPVFTVLLNEKYREMNKTAKNFNRENENFKA